MSELTPRFFSDADPLWYKDAIIYELHIRAFFDSNADGMGDFPGLTQKLDYLQDLGITAIWLLPFFPSPWKDDGYDIADYKGVHPAYGTLRDVRQLVREAHRRGLRVIGELVCNHTSDQHAWFQRSRRAKPGSPWRDFYVWSDNPTKYSDARIIFKDFERSNWSWDPVANAYYWHRFFHHQPDLNFDNPRVRQAVFDAMDFWLDLGLDGLRLDAIPYLFEREGTNCENLPETHAYLKELRRHIDAKYHGRMLLAEANQWPEDTIPYFGDGDECHMAFHFPIMPRLFMALRTEDRFPLLDILAQTPPIPATAQWSLFLRNHDELTLEMVTEEERDYMWRVYAQDPRARINLGIRRRLAPLLGASRRRIELMNALLFSLPGTPVLYYGDEIGMGDNLYLGDRNGVRTPMQWSADRNAGFSTADSPSLYLPVIGEGEYDYRTVNVAVQQANSHSLLWWMKRLIALRKRHPAFGRGTLEFLRPENRKILAFIRRYEQDTLLVVANLSRYVQAVQLDLSAYQGMTPVEMFSGNEFPPVGEQAYLMTLGPHDFYWFSLEAQPASRSVQLAQPEATLPSLTVSAVDQVFRGNAPAALADILSAYLKAQGPLRGRRISEARLVDAIRLPIAEKACYLTVVELRFVEGEPEMYMVPLATATGEQAEELQRTQPQTVLARLRVRQTVEAGVLYDATTEPGVGAALVRAIAERRTLRGLRGEAVGLGTDPGRKLGPLGATAPSAIRLDNTHIFITQGDYNLKLYRQLQPGPHPDLEIGRFLAEQNFTPVPPLLGALEYVTEEGGPITLAILQRRVPHSDDGLSYTLDALSRYYERVVTLDATPSAVSLTTEALLELAQGDILPEIYAQVGLSLEAARWLGLRLAELHRTLSSQPDNPVFAPEPFTSFYQRSIYQSTRTLTVEVMQRLSRRLSQLPEPSQPRAQRALERETQLLDRFRTVMQGKITALRLRCHGHFELSDVLYTGNDFLMQGFEGDPTRPLSERRIKVSPLRDVGSLLMSIHQTAYTALQDQVTRGVVREDALTSVEPWARLWIAWVSAAFLKAYQEGVGQAPFLPQTRAELVHLLDVFRLRKAVYALGQALDGNPNQAHAPLTALLDVLV